MNYREMILGRKIYRGSNFNVILIGVKLGGSIKEVC